MSISAFQEKFLNKGCGPIMGVTCALVMGMFVFQTCGQQQQQQQQIEQREKANTIAVVGGQPVPLAVVESAINEQTTQQLSQLAASGQPLPGAIPLSAQANIAVQAVSSVVAQQLITVIAQQNGIKLDDASLLAEIDRQISELKKTTRERLIKEGKLKPTDGEDKLDKELETVLQGQKVADLKPNLEKVLKDPTKRPSLVLSLARAMLGKQLEAKSRPTDADLEDSYKTLVVKKIAFRDDAKGKEPAAARAEKAAAEIKAGKRFEDVLEAFTDEKPFGKQKVSEQSTDIMASMIDTPEFKALKGLLTGQVSEIVTTAEGMAIYKVVSIRTALPTDFATKKEEYRSQLASKKASEAFTKLLDAALDGNLIQWNNQGYRLLFNLARAYSDPTKMQQRTEKVGEEALKLVQSGSGAEIRPAMFALFLANGPNPMGMPAPAQDPEKRITVLEAVLKAGGEDNAVRLELVDLYAKKKDGAKVADTLLGAAKANTNYEAFGQRVFGDIAGKLVQLKASKVLTDDQVKLVEAEQARWRQARIDFDKVKQQAEAEQIKLQKENEELIKRQKAEAGIKDDAPKPKTGGLLPPNAVPPSSPAPAGSGKQ